MNESSSPTGFVAPEPAELAPLFPSYEIHDLIATGGMGAVYRAVQKSLDRTVALKILPLEFSEDAEFCAGFEAEAKAMARLNHPNLIGVHDFGEVNGMLFIVMEFVPGKSIYHSAYGKAIDPHEVIRLVTGVCNGLAHAHENGILHRDIKPSNILLTPQAEPKIGDFGLARPVETKTQAGEVIFGTPGYTAPEVVDAPETVDHRADLFSVGVLLHELLTGKLPADDPRPASVIAGCDARFDAIIRRATNPVPGIRYSSAAQIAAELQQITSARATSPIAKAPAVAKGGARRPPQPVRTASAGAKRKSMNLTWIGPLVAVSIMAFSWYTFINMKPRVMVIEDPAAKSAADESSIGEVDPFASSAATQTAPPSLPPPSRLPVQPPVSSSQEVVKPEAYIRQSVFLDDLKETEVKIGYGRLGKHGSGPERSGSRALVKGNKPEHSLCPHPHQYGTSSVSYALNGQFSVFSGTATIADGHQQRSLRFRIKGDGKTLWRSNVIETGKDANEFRVSVEGINKLELEIECPASAAGAWGMWVSPQLLRTSTPEQASGTANFKSTENAGLKNNLIDTSIERSSSTSREKNSAIPPDAKLFNGKKYFAFEKKCNWTEASRRCESMGGQLAVIPDEATNVFIKDMAKGRTLWLGATDESQEGKLKWVDGTEMTFKSFSQGQPDNARGDENYLMIWPNGLWNDAANIWDRVLAHKPVGYICEWPDKPVDFAAASNSADRTQHAANSDSRLQKDSATPNPSSESADLATWKNKALEEFPALKDPNSKLSLIVKSIKEKKETLSPSFFKDTQWPYLLAKEGNLVLEQHAQAAKDRYARRFPAGAKSFNGKKYLVYEENVTWNRARIRCNDVGGQLAVIPDAATQAFIRELAQGRSLWLGATDERNEGKWVWVDGTKMEFRAFERFQPNNAGADEHFLMSWTGGLWNDAADKGDTHGIRVTGYICEWRDTPMPGAASETASSDSPDTTTMSKIIDRTIDKMSATEKKQLGQSISRNDIKIFDEMIIRAFKEGLVIASEMGSSRVIVLKETNPKKAPFGYIGKYYSQQERAKNFGSPIEGEFALFEDRYRLHVFDKAIIVWRKSDSRLASAIFDQTFH